MRLRYPPPAGARPKVRRAAGFTLIELMVAASLAMLLLAGAFEMHTAFNRQNIRQQEVADMQQSLRVAMQIIGRSVRDAGTGLAGGTAQLFSLAVGIPQPCPVPVGAPPTPNPLVATHNCLWPVQYSNANAYTHPKLLFDVAPVDNDVDADWLRVVSFDGATAVRVDATVPGHSPLGNATIGVTDTRFFTLGGFFLVNNGYPVMLDGNRQPTLGWRTSCIRQVTGVAPAPNPAGAVPTPGTVSFSPNPNNPNAGDACMASVFAGASVPGKSLLTYMYPVDRSVVFRVRRPVDGRPPRLEAWFSSPTQPSYLYNVPDGQQGWQPLTENIDNMQVALVMNDGTICGNSTNSVDSTALCDPQRVRAVRVTLVARSSSGVGGVAAGLFSGWMSQGTGGQWEDFAQPVQQDGFLRRSLTSEFQIRNVPWGR